METLRLIPSAFVFSHPNHELAVYGALQRLKPTCIVYLTDGGGQHRVDQTNDGLSAIGLLDSAVFLNHSEGSFYGALVDKNYSFFRSVANQLAQILSAHRLEQVFCDAIEYYNPVHDLALPITRYATSELRELPVFEIPLVYQSRNNVESYEFQRVPLELLERAVEFNLEPIELAAKVSARNDTYTILANDLGPIFQNISPEHGVKEFFMPAVNSVFSAEDGRLLRYEQRARLLKERGEIPEEITYKRHFLPIARQLWGLA